MGASESIPPVRNQFVVPFSLECMGLKQLQCKDSRERKGRRTPFCTCFIPPTHSLPSPSLSFSGFPTFGTLNRTTSSKQIWGKSVLCKITRALIFPVFIFAAFTQDSKKGPLGLQCRESCWFFFLVFPLFSTDSAAGAAFPGCQEAAPS